MNVRSKLTSALSSLKNQVFSMSKDTLTSRQILSDIEAAITKSTDHLPEDRYVNEILFLVSNSPGSITFLARRLSARLQASRDPAAALKTLALLHRLLRGGDRFFEQDLRLLWSSGDLRMSPLHHQSVNPFVLNYSLFLQERVDWLISQSGKLEPVRPQDCGDKAVELVLYNLSRCQVFLDRVMACMPESRGLQQGQLVIMFVLNIIVRESFRVYDGFCDGVEIVISSFFHVSRPERLSALGILRKAIMQTPKLLEFYDLCKRAVTGKNLEYPLVRVITVAQIVSLEQFAAEEEAQMKENVEKEREDVEEMKMEAWDDEWSNPFSQKLETKISTVWVEFGEGDDDPLTVGEGSKSCKLMVLL